MKTSLSLNTNHKPSEGITRRGFLKGLGSVIVCPRFWVGGSTWITTCFVGVGALGYEVARQLVKLGFDRGDDGCQFPILLFERDYPRIQAHVNADSVVVLCGSLEDRDFCCARDLVQALKQHFLISLVPGYFTPDLNEAIVLDRSLSVEHWLIPCGGLWLGMDYAEVRMLMAATISNIIRYQAETLSTVQFKDFLRQNMGLLRRCLRVYCHLSIVYPEEVEIEKYVAVLREQLPAEVLWESHQAIRAGSKLEMHLVCSWRQYDL